MQQEKAFNEYAPSFMNKEVLRTTYKAMRSALSPEERQRLSMAIANQILRLPIWEGKNYHLFLTSEKLEEVDTHPLWTVLEAKDKQIVVSKMRTDSVDLQHFLIDENTLFKTNRFGIPEPIHAAHCNEKQIDVVFVPLLVADQTGQRVGYGKGYYDVFLSKCRKDVIKVGLSFFEPIQKIEDTRVEDVPLDFLVTPSGGVRF